MNGFVVALSRNTDYRFVRIWFASLKLTRFARMVSRKDAKGKDAKGKDAKKKLETER